MSASKCSSKNPATCRYHGHEEQVAIAMEQKRVAEANKDFEAYFTASKTLEALEKKKQVVEGLDTALEEAQATGDFNRYFKLTEGVEQSAEQEAGYAALAKALGVTDESPTPVEFRKNRPYQRHYRGSDGEEYTNSLHHSIYAGVSRLPPRRIFSEDEQGNARAFVNAEDFNHDAYPNVMRLQASRPLTDDEVAKVAQLTGFTHRKTLNGEGLSDPERDGSAAVILSTDNTKSYGRKSQFGSFEDKLGHILRYGSDVRKTNRSGAGTMGTRLVEGIGNDVSFTLYYQDPSVTFDNQ